MLNKVEICGVNTAKLPVLTNDEKQRLFIRIKQGDKLAREEFVQGNLRLVLSVIQKFSGRGENADDLFQVGCIGLMKSIDNFDLGQNVKFSTYAVPMIIGEIRRYLRDNNSIRVSRSIRDTAYKALQTRSELEKDGNEPTLQTIAEHMQVAVTDVSFALDAISDTVSLYEPVYTGKDDTLMLMDQIGDQKNTDERWTERVALDTAVGGLGEREKQIIYSRYFEGKTQTEISREIGSSQAQVSRLEKTALKEIKNAIRV